MRRLLLAAIPIVATVIGVATPARPATAAPSPTRGTISINEPGPYAFGDVVTFTTTANNLKGSQWPMVYVECDSTVDGVLLYGMLDHPDAGFLLGGAWSPWWDDPDNAVCVGKLYAYSKQAGAPGLLAQTETFFAVGP